MHEHSKRFNPSKLQRLEDPDRHKQLPVDRIISTAAIKPKMSVADIGAGTGYFAIPIAKLIAPRPVYAVDVAPEMLDYLNNKLAQPTMPKNIELVRGEATATALPDAVCDVVFTSTVWHEIDDHAAALREFARILKPGGRVVIVDWSPDAVPPPGPPSDHRIPRAQVETTLTESGWKIATSQSASSWTYIVVATR